MPVEATGPANTEGKTEIKRLCPYCDLLFILAFLIATAALVVSMVMQSALGVWALVVFVFTLSNCFCHLKTKRLGLVAAGLLQLAYGFFSIAPLLNESGCNSGTLLVPCSSPVRGVAAGLWIASGILILHFVFSGRVREYIKEGLEIEAVATPLGSLEEDLEEGDLESGQDDGSLSESDGSRSIDEAQSTCDDSRSEATPEPARAPAVVSVTICEIPDIDLEGLSDEKREKLEESLRVPWTPARPMDESERSTVSYLPCGMRDWDATN